MAKTLTRLLTVRLLEDQMVEVELVARVLRTSTSNVVRTAIAEYLSKRMGEVEFRQRLAVRIAHDQKILARLVEGDTR